MNNPIYLFILLYPTENSIQMDSLLHTRSYYCLDFSQKLPVTPLQFGKLQTETTGHKLEWLQIVRDFILC